MSSKESSQSRSFSVFTPKCIKTKNVHLGDIYGNKINHIWAETLVCLVEKSRRHRLFIDILFVNIRWSIELLYYLLHIFALIYVNLLIF